MQTTTFNLARYPVRRRPSGQLVRKITQVKAEVHLDMLHSHDFIGHSLPPWKLNINAPNMPLSPVSPKNSLDIVI